MGERWIAQRRHRKGGGGKSRVTILVVFRWPRRASSIVLLGEGVHGVRKARASCAADGTGASASICLRRPRAFERART